MAEQEPKKDINHYWEKLGILTASLQDAAELIKLSFLMKHVVCLVGEAGIGKTQIFQQVADDLNYGIQYFYLAHLEREDLGGIPMPNEDKSAYKFLCEENILNLINTPKPVVLLLDEWNRGEKPVMNAAFTLMEQRRFGGYTLPDHIFIGAAMNPSEGAYLVNEAEKDPAFRRRLCFVGIRTDAGVWYKWATGRGKIHHLVSDYIAVKPDHLMDVPAREAGKIYANPASWEKVSDTLHTLEKHGKGILSNTTILRLKLAGHIGAGMTESFFGWVANQATAINPMEILIDYEKQGQAKVRALAKKNKNDALTEVCDAVAVTVATQPDKDKEAIPTEELAKNVGKFLGDLPEEVAMAFLNKLTSQLTTIGKPQYAIGWSRQLSKVESYQKVIQRIEETNTKVKDEKEGKRKNKKDENDEGEKDEDEDDEDDEDAA